MKRLLVCQGSVQYVAAAVAAETCSGGGADAGHQDTVLLHGLSLWPEQDAAWGRSLAEMARRIDGVQRVVHLPADQADALANLPWQAAIHHLRQLLDEDRFDEVYLQQNDNALNRLAAAAYGRAKRICFGDGIGVNYSQDYWYPRQDRRAARRSAAARQRDMDRRWPPIRRHHRYCLLLPNLFDHTVRWRLTRPRMEGFTRRFAQLAQLSRFVPPWPPDTPVVAILTSCFSEAKRMNVEAECEAYEMYAAQGGDTSQAALVIKPHPRDHPDKVDRLVERLSGRFTDVAVLADGEAMFLPFEAFFVRHWLELGHRARVLCFSSACLSLEYLYGHRCELGFGDELVRRLFDPIYITARLDQERELNRAVHIIRGCIKSFGRSGGGG